MGTKGYSDCLRVVLQCRRRRSAKLTAAEMTPGTVPGSSATAANPTIEAAARASTAEAELLAMLDLEIEYQSG